MAIEKISITDKLRYDIINRRKSNGFTCYELSEQTGNGHSKFWLQNIESGKTKKISKDDLLSLYMTMEDTDDEEYIVSQIEQVLNQSIGDSSKKWYELINISDDYSENRNDNSLMDELEDLLEDKIVPQIQSSVFGMSTHQKQAALSALQNFYYSFYKNPDLTFALANIPLYGVSDSDNAEYQDAINDILAIGAKYNDLVIKNKSLKTIQYWKEMDKYYEELDKQTIQTAFKNFQIMIQKIYKSIHSNNIDMFELTKDFNVEVSFMIERGQPNVLKHYLKSFRIHTGKDFVIHINECISWFKAFQHQYDLPYLYATIDKEELNEIYDFLNNYGDIRPIL